MGKIGENGRKRPRSMSAVVGNKNFGNEVSELPAEAGNAKAGEQIEMICREKRISVVRLARKAEVSAQTLYSIIGGKAVSFRTASKVSEALSINLDRFEIKDARRSDLLECFRCRRQELRHRFL
jgi:hypothetical protein